MLRRASKLAHGTLTNTAPSSLFNWYLSYNSLKSNFIRNSKIQSTWTIENFLSILLIFLRIVICIMLNHRKSMKFSFKQTLIFVSVAKTMLSWKNGQKLNFSQKASLAIEQKMYQIMIQKTVSGCDTNAWKPYWVKAKNRGCCNSFYIIKTKNARARDTRLKEICQ